MPTLKEVAAEAGVSTVTASSVLSGADRVRVSSATRDRIRRVAREMNYVPRAAARGLRTGKAETIAFLTAGHTNSRWQPHWQDVLRGVSDVLWDREEKLVLSMPRNPDHEIEILRQLAFGHQVDGLLIQEVRPEDSRLDLLRESGVPFVSLGGILRDDVHHVDFDIHRFARVLAEDLLRRHDALACVAGPPGDGRHGAFLDACREVSESRGRPFHAWTGAYLPDREWFLRARAEASEGPLAVLLVRHLLPEIVSRLGEAGLALETDVRVAYLSGGETLLLPTAGIEVIALDYYTLGRRAAKRLFQLVDAKEERLAPQPMLVFPSTLEHLLPG